MADQSIGMGLGTVVLASQSPRRLELLRTIGIEPVVRPADVDETPKTGESPATYVARVARDKADAAVRAADLDGPTLILAADTTVDFDDEIIAKPTDDDDARRILRRLSGRTHLVHTAVVCAAIGPASAQQVAIVDSVTVTTRVTFTALADADIEWYLATGEHADKAGAYGMQGAAGAFIERIDGSPSNVIGLPLAQTRALLIAASEQLRAR